MRVEINKLHPRLGATMIFVTHDQVEAMTLADRIVVLRSGRIEQVGTPLDLYNRPENLFVAGFIGSPRMNFLEGEVLAENGGLVAKGRAGIAAPAPADAASPGDKVTIGIRPAALQAIDPAGAPIVGEIQIAEHLGGATFLYVALPSGESVVVEIQGQLAGHAGERVGIGYRPENCHLFAGDGWVLAGRDRRS
jgi:multiple sugar transport system ATP-binding protein